jgi:hypothetical protein
MVSHSPWFGRTKLKARLQAAQGTEPCISLHRAKAEYQTISDASLCVNGTATGGDGAAPTMSRGRAATTLVLLSLSTLPRAGGWVRGWHGLAAARLNRYLVLGTPVKGRCSYRSLVLAFVDSHN